MVHLPCVAALFCATDENKVKNRTLLKRAKNCANNLLHLNDVKMASLFMSVVSCLSLTLVIVVEIGARGVKVRTAECQRCVWSVARLSVHRATVVRRTLMV